MRPEQVWQAALGELQLQMTRATYDTWLRDTTLVSSDDDTFVIGLKNAYARDWLENRLRTTIQRTLTGIKGQSVDVKFVVLAAHEPVAERAAVVTPRPGPVAAYHNGNGANSGDSSGDKLNPRYRFDNFVVGPSNRLAHAAAMAVSENPARDYNPLFLYGGVGLGKTHLLQAVGNACSERGLSVLYVSSEEFTNDLINAIRARTTDDFRDKYRTLDVLLVDDIQFIAGKEATQEEFFHTFNTLHGQSKQIVVSSDRSPKALVTLEERLRSRFEWGLTADVQPPDIETRIAILQAKADEKQRMVPNDVLELIARRVQSNIRELEGALNKVLAYTDILGHPLTLETTNIAIADLLPRRSTMNTAQIVETVSMYYNVPVESLLGRDRRRDIAFPRQVIMYLAREETSASLPAIGKALGGRDHTTVIHGYEKIADLMETDDATRRQIIAIRERLYADNNIGADVLA